jgi:hypothetical protein
MQHRAHDGAERSIDRLDDPEFVLELLHYLLRLRVFILRLRVSLAAARECHRRG